MVLFLVLNTSGLALLPLGVISLRAAAGSQDAAGNPGDHLVCQWLRHRSRDCGSDSAGPNATLSPGRYDIQPGLTRTGGLKQPPPIRSRQRTRP